MTPDELKDWLNDLPRVTEEQRQTARRIAVAIATRAAARVFLLVVDDGTDKPARGPNLDASVISTFRAMAITLVASLRPTTDMAAANPTLAAADAGLGLFFAA